MLDFPGQALELSMLAGRGTKWPPKALFDIISSSGRSPEELFLRFGNFPASVRQMSVCKHFLLSHLLQDHWLDFLKLGQNVPLSV